MDSQGTYISEDNNIQDCVFREKGEDCMHSMRGFQDKTSLFCVGLFDSQLCYGVIQSSYLYKVYYSSYSDNCIESMYLDTCKGCSYCFACVGLKQKKYCIFNKQYTEAEYYTLIGQIQKNMKKDGERGKFLPYDMAYTGYNTTLGRLFFPQAKETIQHLQGHREEDTPQQFTGDQYNIPDDSRNISPDLVNKAIQCIQTKSLFNYTPQAIVFLQRNNLAVPTVAHVQRILSLFEPLQYIKPQEGVCSETGEQITHYYPEKLGYKHIVSKEWYDKNI
jgi:hypothetical protein